MEFDPRSHRYSVVDGDHELSPPPPSVTTVCGIIDKSGPLVGWAVKETLGYCRAAILPHTAYGEITLDTIWDNAKRAHRTRKQEAADIGTQAHRLIEDALRADAVDELAKSGHGDADGTPVLACAAAAGAWLSAHDVRPLAIERRVYSRRHRFIGTLDQLAMVDGELCLVDWKTSNGIYPEHRLQTAAYQLAYEEETDLRINKRYLVRLGKDGAFEAHMLPRKDYAKDKRAFLGALALWRRIQELK